MNKPSNRLKKNIITILVALFLVCLSVPGVPNVVSASTTYTFYPNADPETTSVDGFTEHIDIGGLSWANIIAGGGTHSFDSTTGEGIPMFSISSVGGVDDWGELGRVAYLFNTSSIPDDYIISSATLSIYVTAKSDPENWQPDLNVYTVNPASNTQLVPADHSTFGSTPLSTALSYGGLTILSWNSFGLNATGVAGVSKTGITKLGLRNANYDVAGVSPVWVANKSASISARLSDFGGGFAPQLVVVATPPPSAAGGFILRSLLRVVLAGAILVGVIMIGRRGGSIALLVSAVIGIIAFVIVNSIINTLF